jgi:hypothetical protein
MTLQSFAQTLEQKQKELEEAQAEYKQQKARVAQLKSEVNALLPPVYWKKGGAAIVNFNSLGLTNWAAGGVPSNALAAAVSLRANYKKDKITWENNLDLAYGLIQNIGEPIRKNEDRIDLTSLVGRRINDKFNFSGRFNFLSQFAPGFDFSNTEIEDDKRPVISRFMAPAFLNLALGIDYRVNEHLSIFMSPASGKFTFVLDDSIAAENIYIPSTTDEQGIQYYNDNYRAELGFMLNFIYQKEFLDKKLNFRTNLNLFNNITDVNQSNRKNTDIISITEIKYKITEYIGVRLFGHLIYDNDIAIPTSFGPTGEVLTTGPRAQFMRVFGVGFAKNF